MNNYLKILKTAFLLLAFTLAMGCGADPKEHAAVLRAYDQSGKLVFESTGIKGINIDTEMMTATIELRGNNLEAIRAHVTNGEMLKLYIDKVHIEDARFLSVHYDNFIQLSMIDPASMGEVFKKAGVPFTQNDTSQIVGKLKIYDDKNNLLFTSKRVRGMSADENSMMATITLQEGDDMEIAKAVSGRELLKLYIDDTYVGNLASINPAINNIIKFKFSDLHAIELATMLSAVRYTHTSKLIVAPKNSNSQNPAASTAP